MARAGTGEESQERGTTESKQDIGGRGPVSPPKQEMGGVAGVGTVPASSPCTQSGTGTRVFVLNLRKVQGSPELDWESEPDNILIRSRRARSRPNQMCRDVSSWT